MAQSSPVDPDRYVGTVVQVTAGQIYLNLPHAAAWPERRNLARGSVGDFVFVDCDKTKLLGRLTETRIPDSERLSVEPKLGNSLDPHPIGRAQLLASVDPIKLILNRGISTFPKVGDGVYLAEPHLLAQLIQGSVLKSNELNLPIGRMQAADNAEVALSPESVFGRHCGVFGATGGGKSWTLASLIESLKAAGGKALVIDPTGEFEGMSIVDRSFVFDAPSAEQQLVHFPYTEMTEDDLFALFRPSGLSQGPKLREAIKSLKLVRAIGVNQLKNIVIKGGSLEKQLRPRADFFNALGMHADAVHSVKCDFDISKLSIQIRNECVYANDKNLTANFGGVDGSTLSYCETLIARVEQLQNSKELECLFAAKGASLVDELNNFFASKETRIALISFKDIRFEHGTREIFLNIIGRHLLRLARDFAFRKNPLVVFLDEAHQFLGRTIGDDYASVRLDAFGLIAKEGRKYALTCVLATQRPRDVPADVMSQLGTLFVHRLTNDQDREMIERACGDLDRGAAQFIPMLAPGEAVVIGPDLPAPVPLYIRRPNSPPNSRGPDYERYWGKASKDSGSTCEPKADDAPKMPVSKTRRKLATAPGPTDKTDAIKEFFK